MKGKKNSDSDVKTYCFEDVAVLMAKYVNIVNSWQQEYLTRRDCTFWIWPI